MVRVPDVSDTFTVCEAGAEVGWVAVNVTGSEVEPVNAPESLGDELAP